VARRSRRAQRWAWGRWAWEPESVRSAALPRACRHSENGHLLRSRKFGSRGRRGGTRCVDTARSCAHRQSQAYSSPNTRPSWRDTQRWRPASPRGRWPLGCTGSHCCHRSRAPRWRASLRRTASLSLVPRREPTTTCSRFTQRTRNRRVRGSPSGSTPDEFRCEVRPLLRTPPTAASPNWEVHSVSPPVHRGSTARRAPDEAR